MFAAGNGDNAEALQQFSRVWGRLISSHLQSAPGGSEALQTPGRPMGFPSLPWLCQRVFGDFPGEWGRKRPSSSSSSYPQDTAAVVGLTWVLMGPGTWRELLTFADEVFTMAGKRQQTHGFLFPHAAHQDETLGRKKSHFIDAIWLHTRCLLHIRERWRGKGDLKHLENGLSGPDGGGLQHCTQQVKVRNAGGWKAPGFAACCPEPRGCLVPAVLSCLRRVGEDQQRCLGASGFQTNKQHLRACQSNR